MFYDPRGASILTLDHPVLARGLPSGRTLTIVSSELQITAAWVPTRLRHYYETTKLENFLRSTHETARSEVRTESPHFPDSKHFVSFDSLDSHNHHPLTC